MSNETKIHKHHFLLSQRDTHSGTSYKNAIVAGERSQMDLAEMTLHRLFEMQVERTPDAIAVVFEEEHLSYREINRRANQLAWYLRQKGVRSDCMVGIYMERSLDMVQSILGILKAGGAYVPLDPEYPQERLSFILRDTALSVLLTQQSLEDSLPHVPLHRISVDKEQRSISQQIDKNRVSADYIDQLAYVIYTSGSTGAPKGVLISHRALVTHCLAIVQSHTIGADDRILQFSTISFDIAAEEFFPAWLTGAPVVLRTEQASTSLLRFTQLVEKNQLTILNLATPYWHEWVNELSRTGVPVPASVRLVLVGGEKALPDRLSVWQKLAGEQVHWVNAYGPTETTISATVYDLPASSQRTREEQPVPIGHPLPNTTVYVLDAHFQQVPANMPGELYIGGTRLARGYLHRPDQTAERFIPDPFSTQPGARLYKTGDIVRYNEDNELEYLGRLDNQVKVRGFRIELEEVEHALGNHALVQDCVVTTYPDPSGEMRLIAYVVPTSGENSVVQTLRRDLKKVLPEYMVPSLFYLLPALPLTSHGKIDRHALPDPDSITNMEPDPSVAPRTPTEEQIYDIWTQVLNRKHVGIFDNFFEIGGHSLLATQIISRVRNSWNCALSLPDFFASPTIAGLAALVEASSSPAEKRQIPPPSSIARTDSIPLSFAQQRLWFFDQLLPDSSLYNVQLALRLRGELDRGALQKSLQEIVRRHEALRTTIVTRDEHPFQCIQPPAPLPLEILELGSVPPDEGETRLQQWLSQLGGIPFDLSRDVLLRCYLIQINSFDAVLLLVTHHIVSDGWSVGVLLEELTSLYAAFVAGQPSPLPDLPIQYADYALWQRQWLQGQILEEQLAYWREHLHPDNAELVLPTDYPRPAVQSYRGRSLFFQIPGSLTQQLRQLGQQHEVTLFMTLLAAFQILLWRYSGQEEIVIGTPIANRTHVETESLIGYLANTLVLGTMLGDNPTFAEALARVRATTLGAYAHQDVPFELLVEYLQPRRDPGRNPLFQVLFVLQNAPLTIQDMAGVQLQLEDVESGTAKFDLVLDLEEQTEGIRGRFEYSTDLFTAKTIERMVEHFQRVLSQMVRDPKQRIGLFSLLGEQEYQQIVVQWNQTEQAYPDACLQQLVGEQVRRTPDAIAVVYEQEQISYAELNRQANQLAHYLQYLGVRPDVLVGICLERSIEMVISVLAVLKAGGAYVPLDPEYPQERLAAMLEDAELSIVVTQEKLKDMLPPHNSYLLCLEREASLLKKQQCTDIVLQTLPEQLAYVIYTSGSTGRPKGTALPHRALVNLIRWHHQALGQHRRILQFASLSFDVSFHEIFSMLTLGGTVFVIPALLRQDLHDLLDYIEKNKINKYTLPVALLQQLAEEFIQQDLRFSYPQDIIATGEALHLTGSLAVIFDQSPARLHNHYGPSETHLATTYTLPERTTQWPTNPPIGLPITNIQLYILDPCLQPVPVGVPGELYISGICLARGYLHRADLTAERFLPDPFSEDRGKRMYKTGDIVRYRSDGAIEYLGRRDNQVKLRGFRIELSEIEAILLQHPAVRECVVLLQEEDASDKRLIAYLVTTPEHEVTSGELRLHVKRFLPEYMVPSVFRILPAFPLTSNGKIDRKQLPRVKETQRADLAAHYAAPNSEVEKKLAALWGDVLKITDIGIHDNFFELGGHSLLAIRLMSQIRQQFQRHLPLSILFQNPTIEQLAHVFLQDTSSCTSSPLVEIKPGSSHSPFFCVHPIGGEVLCYADLARYLALDSAFYGLRTLLPGTQKERSRTIEEIAADYIKAIRTVQAEGPYQLGGWSMGGLVAFEMARQLKIRGHDVSLLALVDTLAETFDAQYREYDHTQLVNWFLRDLEASLGVNVPLSFEDLKQLREEDQLPAVLEKGRNAHAFLQDIDIYHLEHLFSIFSMNLEAMLGYKPEEYKGRVVLFRAANDVENDLEVPENIRVDLGWRALTRGHVDIQFIPGSHYTMLQEPHVCILAQRLKKYLEHADFCST